MTFDIKLTDLSRIKFDTIFIEHNKSIDNKHLNILLNKLHSVSLDKLDISLGTLQNINDIHKIFLDFDQNINNISNSKFQKDINQMHNTITIHLNTDNGIINFHFLFSDFNQNLSYISIILHATHTICKMYSVDYNGLSIYVSLDDNPRILNYPDNLVNYDQIFNYLKKKSAAFCVSGVTQPYKKQIILTKKQEIIKLLFHELVHYIGLDRLLYEQHYYPWATNPSTLNLSEAYTEFLSVVFYTMYVSLYSKNYITTFKKLIHMEIDNSFYLSAHILLFYGYNKDNIANFFNGIGEKKQCPIHIWEYVIVRTILLHNIEYVFNLLETNLRINKQNSGHLKKLMKEDNSFINKLINIISKKIYLPDVSYLMIDVDWDKI